MTIYGYARVSTNDQSLDGQVIALTRAGADKIFSEKLSGARKENRPELAALLKCIGPGDTLLVTALDRLGRSSRDLHNILHDISSCGATFKSLRESWADTTNIQGRLFISILAALAEMERELIKARTGEGRSRARAAGRRLGGPQPKLSQAQRDAARERLAAGERASVVGRELGVSTDTIRRLRKLA